MYQTKILLDSVSPLGVRLTTWELTYPRFVHAELMTHRVFSRNSASSRAIPAAKMIERIALDPVFPKWWGKNQSGMQAMEEMSPEDIELTKQEWLELRDINIKFVERWNKRGLHKQIANRPLETWMFITVILTATHHKNWFALRKHPDAQPEIQWVASSMYEQYLASKPTKLEYAGWHLPLLHDRDDLLKDGFSQDDLPWISSGRCARVSYLTHDGVRDPNADIDLAKKLAVAGHMSPFEHSATPMPSKTMHGNFLGWKQFRKFLPNEDVFPHNSHVDLSALGV